MNINSLCRVAQATDKSCELGFIHSAFLIGHRVQNFGFRRNADNVNHPEHDVMRFERLSHSWEFIDGTVISGQAADEWRAEKLAGREEAYICAVLECRIEAKKKATLKQCGGSCSAPKHRYCSKECQRSDWRRRKVYCRLGAEPNPTVTDALGHIEPPEKLLADDESMLDSPRSQSLMSREGGDDRFNTDGLQIRVPGSG